MAVTQLPPLLGVAGGGQHAIERLFVLAGQVPGSSLLTLAVGLMALALLVTGGRTLPGQPVALGVVALAILVAGVFSRRRDPRDVG
jgi:MFS superfamily sulfate permease-like transporter